MAPLRRASQGRKIPGAEALNAGPHNFFGSVFALLFFVIALEAFSAFNYDVPTALPINHEVSWKALVVGYLALSGLSLVLPSIPLPAAIVVPLSVILGPTAWLSWGYDLAPVYFLATAIFAACVIGAIFLEARSRPLGRLAVWILGVIWLLLGVAAYSFTV